MFYGGHVTLRAGRNIYYWLCWRRLESCPQNWAHSIKYQSNFIFSGRVLWYPWHQHHMLQYWHC